MEDEGILELGWDILSGIGSIVDTVTDHLLDGNEPAPEKEKPAKRRRAPRSRPAPEVRPTGS